MSDYTYMDIPDFSDYAVRSDFRIFNKQSGKELKVRTDGTLYLYASGIVFYRNYFHILVQTVLSKPFLFTINFVDGNEHNITTDNLQVIRLERPRSINNTDYFITADGTIYKRTVGNYCKPHTGKVIGINKGGIATTISVDKIKRCYFNLCLDNNNGVDNQGYKYMSIPKFPKYMVRSDLTVWHKDLHKKVVVDNGKCSLYDDKGVHHNTSYFYILLQTFIQQDYLFTVKFLDGDKTNVTWGNIQIKSLNQPVQLYNSDYYLTIDGVIYLRKLNNYCIPLAIDKKGCSSIYIDKERIVLRLKQLVMYNYGEYKGKDLPVKKIKHIDKNIANNVLSNLYFDDGTDENEEQPQYTYTSIPNFSRYLVRSDYAIVSKRNVDIPMSRTGVDAVVLIDNDGNPCTIKIIDILARTILKKPYLYTIVYKNGDRATVDKDNIQIIKLNKPVKIIADKECYITIDGKIYRRMYENYCKPYVISERGVVVFSVNGKQKSTTIKALVFDSYGEYKGKHVKSQFIEHIDGDTTNNHIDNLRLVNMYGEGLL